MLGSSPPNGEEAHWTRGHPEYQKVLEPLMTGAVNSGDLSAFPACGSPVPGSPIEHRLCHVAGGWRAQQREAQAKPLWGGQSCRSSLCFAITLPMTTHFRKAEHGPFQMLTSLCSLLCLSEVLWLIVISWRALLSPRPMYTAAIAKQVSSYSLMPAFPILCISTALTEELFPLVLCLGRAHLKLSVQ